MLDNLLIMDLEPTAEQRQKSFYGKAKVEWQDDNTAVLYSYGTKIMAIKQDDAMIRFWDGWSMTTGKHIKAFSGLNKKQFMALERGF